MELIIKIIRKPQIIWLESLALLLMVGANGISLMIPIISSTFIDTYFKTGKLYDNLLWLAVLFIVIAFVVPFFLTVLNNIIAEKIGVMIKRNLLSKLLAQDYRYLLEKSGPKIFTVLTNDVNNVKDIISRLIPILFGVVFMLIGSAFMMLRTNATVAVPIFITMPIIAVIIFMLFKNVGKLFKIIQEKRDKMNSDIDQNIKAAMLVRVSVAEDAEIEKFNDVNQQYFNVSNDIAKIFSLAFPIFNLSLYIGQLIVIWVGGQEAMKGNLSLGELSSFNIYVILFTMPFIIIGFLSQVAGQAFTSLKRIQEVLETPLITWPGIKSLTTFKSYEMQKVSYSINKIQILNNIDFKFENGQKIGIIGTTGSGKSTLMQLILQFISASSGKVLVNGIDTNELDVTSFRRLIGFVPQQNFLFMGTIFENIDFGRQLHKDTINLAAETAEVLEFADKMPDNLKSDVGERGTKLSGGQKQRVTLARALAGDPMILILDDSTSKLDSETESRIWKKLEKNYPDLTIVVIAQKIASIKDCDCIYIMEDGKLVTKGTHEELLRDSFIYQELELSQSNYQEA